MDYEVYLLEQLNKVKNSLQMDDIVIEIAEEQSFVKMDKLTPDTIYVVVKYLESDLTWYDKTTPIQLIILSEQDSLDKAKIIFNKFANDKNWEVIISGTTYMKTQYNSPVVLNNYAEVSFGYRSVLFMSGVLITMENVVDVTEVKIDNKDVKPLGFTLSYAMATNTQQKVGEGIASSVKTVSTLSIAMTIPLISCDLVTKVINIINESLFGNDNFTVAFSLGTAISKNMKLTSAQINTAPDAVPSLNLGFTR